MKNKVKRKPTAREMASAIIEINGKVNQNTDLIQQLDTVFGYYITMKKDLKKFNVYLQEKIAEREKKDESKRNGDTDGDNLQGNTEDESSGPKRIRKKSK
jgi:predicted metal-dependent peptidase